jgi:hypothetical protein
MRRKLQISAIMSLNYKYFFHYFNRIICIPFIKKYPVFITDFPNHLFLYLLKNEAQAILVACASILKLILPYFI